MDIVVTIIRILKKDISIKKIEINLLKIIPISRNLIRIRRINGTSLWWNTENQEKRDELSFAGSSALKAVLDSLLSITCDAKGAQNLAHTMGEHRLSVARHSLTNTRKVSRNVHEPRHEYSCHWVTTLSSSTKSATRLHAVLWNYRRFRKTTRERRFYFAMFHSFYTRSNLRICFSRSLFRGDFLVGLRHKDN